jgi:hypothetical protein
MTQKKVGRPRIFEEGTETVKMQVHIQLEKNTADFVKKLGAGSMSAGIRQAISIAKTYLGKHPIF